MTNKHTTAVLNRAVKSVREGLKIPPAVGLITDILRPHIEEMYAIAYEQAHKNMIEKRLTGISEKIK